MSTSSLHLRRDEFSALLLYHTDGFIFKRSYFKNILSRLSLFLSDKMGVEKQLYLNIISYFLEAAGCQFKQEYCKIAGGYLPTNNRELRRQKGPRKEVIVDKVISNLNCCHAMILSQYVAEKISTFSQLFLYQK